MIPLVLAISFLVPRAKCVDLSGTYVHSGEENGSYVTIAQTRCERIVMTWAHDNSTRRVPVRLALDGQVHTTNGGLFAFRQVSASLDAATLKLTMTGQSGSDTGNPYTIRLVLLRDGDLCVGDSSSSAPHSRYSRQHGRNSRAQDEAMLRSQQDCSVP